MAANTTAHWWKTKWNALFPLSGLSRLKCKLVAKTIRRSVPRRKDFGDLYLANIMDGNKIIDRSLGTFSLFNKLYAVPFLLAGGFMLWFGISNTYTTATTLAHATHTTGTVLDNATTYSRRGGASYAPHVQFIATNGTTYEFTPSLYTHTKHPIGQLLPIAYDAAQPSHAYVNSFWYTYGLGAILIPFGLIFLIAPFFAVRKTDMTIGRVVSLKNLLTGKMETVDLNAWENDPEVRQAVETLKRKFTEKK